MGTTRTPPKESNSHKWSQAMFGQKGKYEPGGSGGPIAICGFLSKMKKTQRMLTPVWNRRWFALVGHELYYFHSKKDSIPAKTINLLSLEKIRPFEKNDNGMHSFIIKTASRNYFLRADSKSDMQRWVRGLREQQDLWNKKIKASEQPASPQRKPKHYREDQSTANQSVQVLSSPVKNVTSTTKSLSISTEKTAENQSRTKSEPSKKKKSKGKKSRRNHGEEDGPSNHIHREEEKAKHVEYVHDDTVTMLKDYISDEDDGLDNFGWGDYRRDKSTRASTGTTSRWATPINPPSTHTRRASSRNQSRSDSFTRQAW